ncbi:hypothetical protein [Jannaschia sp. M317]|uniref:hypothetical protein n=1 Tax=Jannaschia sp. M317 TaxID=2867011 RepID=UPI0021A46079|nr:hypothetical protein [Jannaschia sp. M317]UWQ19191.1 hypothetical protein K3551_07950 [Jannaschia sp. M317]
MRATSLILSVLSVAVLAACEPPVPDSGARSGAGFDTPDQFAQRRAAEAARQEALRAEAERRREAQLRQAAPTPSQSIQAPTTEAEVLASQTRAALGRPDPVTPDPVDIGAPAPLPTATTATVLPGGPVAPLATGAPAADLDRDNPGLSQEQDFNAVAAERSIQDDAARVRAARQQFELVQPTELERPADNGPNIITYAIEQARPLGSEGSFRRNPLASARRSQINCQGYRSDDIAQEAFLEAGGPARDRLNLDPDGDGNACRWDPGLYKNLVRN